MDREKVQNLLEILRDRGIIDDYKTSGEDHFGFSCIFPSRHESGEDTSPSMTISCDAEGPSFLKCHACRYVGPLLDGLNAANMEHHGVLADVMEWLRGNETAPSVKLARVKTGKKYSIKDYTAELEKFRSEPFPPEAVAFLEKKGCDEKIARRMHCSWVESREFPFGDKLVTVRKSIVYPVLMEHEGQLICVGAQARSVEGKGRNKYFSIFPFQARQHVFGEHLLGKMKGKRILVVEGPLDCMHLLKLGEASVALFGLNASEPKIAKLKASGARMVYVILDPDQNEIRDKDGLRPSERIAKAIEAAGMPAKPLFPTENPKHMVKEQVNALLGNP